MSDVRQTKGFMLLRCSSKLVDEYEKGKVALSNKEYLREIRDAVPFINPYSYKGISREPLSAWSPDDERFIREHPESRSDLENEVAAKKCFLELNGEDREEWDFDENKQYWNPELISTLNQAKEIYSCLIAQKDYEIIEASSEPYSNDFVPIGFDVGYWGGNHFSIICDTVIMPRWHPPIPDDLAELAKQLEKINQYVLFQTVADAAEFRRWYMSKKWAEKEMDTGEFCIIQLSIPKL